MPAKRTGRQYDNLKKNVKALFEEAEEVVKKSTQPLTKPAAKPSTRPTDPPSEKPFTAMLSQKAQSILEQEEERTGEDIPLILERAVINLNTLVTSNTGIITSEGVLLSQKAQDILVQEKERTGENLPLILERAIINLKTLVASDVGVVAPKQKQPAVSITDEDNYKLQVINRIVEMKDNDNLSFDEIAGRFNKEGLITFTGKGQWHGITISAMYKRFKSS